MLFYPSSCFNLNSSSVIVHGQYLFILSNVLGLPSASEQFLSISFSKLNTSLLHFTHATLENDVV